ncbi:hypothetical protein [Siminovitchia terrae]|uniref:hypothetical protein n=1 Tax=Siminovitchia terrae TaxID=1914933 RepID=UPI0028AD92AE|nr:hypothetical protein [Siminovitchia terrae]
MPLTVNKIPLEVDVWNVIKEYVTKDFRKIDIVNLHFRFNIDVDNGRTDINVTVPEGKRLTKKGQRLDKHLSLKLIRKLCETFNIPFDNLYSLEFRLYPGEVPAFKVGLYPYVDDESILDTKKSRMNVITIN